MNERGSTPVELALGVAVILVPIALFVLSFGPWLERQSFVRLASREIARQYVLSDGELATAQLLAMAETYRIEGVRLGMCGAEPVEVVTAGDLIPDACPVLEEAGDVGAPNGGITARVEVDVPIIKLPWRDDQGESVTVGGVVVSSEHTEYVDLYRSFP